MRVLFCCFLTWLTLSSVGLKVTSLKWTGPDRDDPENPAQIPHHMEYRDTVLRAEEIGIPLEDTVHDNALRAQSMHHEFLWIIFHSS